MYNLLLLSGIKGLSYLQKIKKTVRETSFLIFLFITYGPNKTKKYPVEHFAVIRGVGACQMFQFFRQKTWFLRNNRAFPKFLYGILNYSISIIIL